MTLPAIHRGFSDLAVGQIHDASCGPRSAPAVLLLHQSPRSWLEYREVLPLLGQRYRAIAMDTIGFGDSARPPWPPSIERWAEVAAQLLDTLGIAAAHVVGHHTGGVVAIELAAAHPLKVRSLVLSSTPFVDEALRRSRREHPAIDLVAPSTDGSHLMQQWGKRAPFYPTDRPDLLAAYVIDASRVATYRMEERIARVHQPALIVRATADPDAAPHAFELAAQLPQARVVDIEGGMVPLPDQMPQAFAKVVLDFLSAQAQRRLHRKPPMRRPARMQAVSTGARDDST
jgi:pimeloyl-ACP methyl ester carboxylesterase